MKIDDLLIVNVYGPTYKGKWTSIAYLNEDGKTYTNLFPIDQNKEDLILYAYGMSANHYTTQALFKLKDCVPNQLLLGEVYDENNLVNEIIKLLIKYKQIMEFDTVITKYLANNEKKEEYDALENITRKK